MATANQAVEKARSQIGYKEGKNNANKFGEAYGWNYVAWCCQFIWWVLTQVGMEILKTASCTALWNWAKSKGLAVSKNSLKPGDIVFFDFSGGSECNHVGIVESVGSSRVTTIEGNTSAGNSGSQSNGDGVYRRYRSYGVISHAFRPKYDGTSSNTSTGGICNVTVQEVKNGSKGGSVYVLQAFLRAKGYYTGKVDGIAGSLTEKAIKAFQKAMGLSQDGIAGQKTWAAVFK